MYMPPYRARRLTGRISVQYDLPGWRTQPDMMHDGDKGYAIQLIVPDLEGTFTDRRPLKDTHFLVYRQLSPARELDYTQYGL